MPLTESETSKLEAGVSAFARDVDRLAIAHYGRSGADLLKSLNTEEGRKQYARLLGVIVKEPFADEFSRRPTAATKARIGLTWKPPAQIERVYPKTWQGPLLTNMHQANLLTFPSGAGGRGIRGGRSPAKTAAWSKPHRAKPVHAIAAARKSETSLGKAIMRAFHNRICGNPESSKAVKDAIKKAKSEGVKLSDPSVTGISVGAASLVAVTVGSLFSGPIAVAAAPVIGGIALLLMQVGVDGFCGWSGGAKRESKRRR